MKFSTSRRMKLKCSGQSCNHVYEYTDTVYRSCNDPGDINRMRNSMPGSMTITWK